MSADLRSTGYARLSPSAARRVLAGFVLIGLFCVGVTVSPLASRPAASVSEDEGDVALYRAEVGRIHAGESYYSTAADELTGRGYPTRSVFNWRTPLPQWLLGKLPAIVLGKALLALLAAAIVVLSFAGVADEQQNKLSTAVLTALLLTGSLVPCLLGDLFVTPSLWAGICIGLSLAFYGVDRPYLGVAAGLAAVFFRELAMPYCVLALGLAWQEGRRKEMVAWIVGLSAWATFYGLHCWHVSSLITPDARAHSEGWVQFGGAAFVLATARMNAYLILLPPWVAALYFSAAMLGFAGWHTRFGLRAGLTVSAFVVAFAVVGQEFNTYWGWLIGPALAFGAARFPVSIAELWNAANLSAAPTVKSLAEP